MSKPKPQLDHLKDFVQAAIALGAQEEPDKTPGEVHFVEAEIIRGQISQARAVQPFIDFVVATLDLHPFDFDVRLDEVTADGWRVIDIRCFPVGAESWLSTIYLAPSQAERFPPALDIPF